MKEVLFRCKNCNNTNVTKNCYWHMREQEWLPNKNYGDDKGFCYDCRQNRKLIQQVTKRDVNSKNRKVFIKEYSHQFSLSFTLVSNAECKDHVDRADYPTASEMRSAIIERLVKLTDDELVQELGEAIDSYEIVRG